MNENYEAIELDLLYDLGEEETQAPCAEHMPPDEALVDCVNRYGRVDMRYMCRASGLSAEALSDKLVGKAIFQDPAVFQDADRWSPEEGWVLRPRYLTGNLRAKLRLAEQMDARFPGRFAENLSALRRVMPEPLRLKDIHISLGASWIPEFIYADFIKDLLRLLCRPKISYNEQLYRWSVEIPYPFRESVLNVYTYGTWDMPAIRIIEQTMNARTVKVYDTIDKYDGTTERVLNKDKTLAAQEKQRRIILAFEEWAHRDPETAKVLEEHYNDAYVGYCSTAYDGSFLRLPGLNPSVELYPHQKSAVARILLSGENTLLAHDVGTGKTYEMITAAHELRRMGLSRSNMVVVPNNVLRATADAHKLLYPDDRILVVYPRDFSPSQRNEVLERIRNEPFVCVYMAYSSFNMIRMSKSWNVEKQRRDITDLRAAAERCADSGDRYAIESLIERRQKKLIKYIRDTEETPWIPFDHLGITTLFVDEAHNYKNIHLSTRAESIVGMHTRGSSKSCEMLEKCRSVQRIVFSTGTPLTNSLADLYVMQTYLQPELLRCHGIDSFDMWVNTFAERETNFEIDVDARNLRPVTRFTSFHNLSELMALFSTVCDYHPLDEQAEELPQFHGYTDVLVPRNELQTAYIMALSGRTDDIRAHRVTKKEDNLLKITLDGRSAALDIRLVDTSGLEQSVMPNRCGTCKIDVCAQKVSELYRAYPGTCQIVFSDIGTPKAGFNVYDALKDGLVHLGIPAAEIAFIHDAVSDAARAKLFADINKGRIRVAIGSTAKLGVGVNVQEKLIALHHLSVPWRPADMVQREGRIIRRGNTCPEVFIYRYITEGSFDSYSWQLLENKQRFISSFLSGAAGSREQEDIADTVLSYAEVKALAIGNPLIKRRVETANRLERARMSARQRQKQITDLRAELAELPERMQHLETLRDRARRDAAFYAAGRTVVPRDERKAFGEELICALADNHMRPGESLFDSYQGFDIVLPSDMDRDHPYVLVRREGSYYVEIDTAKTFGCAMRIDHLLEELPAREQSFQSRLNDTIRRRDEAQAELEKGNPYLVEIDALTLELQTIDRQLM